MSTIDKATTELHRCFNRLNKQYFNNELPIPAITIQTSGKRKSMGWCSNAPRWEGTDIERYEINISAEYLAIDIMETMDTLLHEMVHLHNRTVTDIKDASRGSGYHNKRFKETCERMNMFEWLGEKPDSKIGYSNMKLTQETKDYITDFIAPKAEAFAMSRNVEMEVGGKKKKSNSFKLECPSCGSKVRASKSGLSIRCKPCDEDMVEEGLEEGDEEGEE